MFKYNDKYTTIGYFNFFIKIYIQYYVIQYIKKHRIGAINCKTDKRLTLHYYINSSCHTRTYVLGSMIISIID